MRKPPPVVVKRKTVSTAVAVATLDSWVIGSFRSKSLLLRIGWRGGILLVWAQAYTRLADYLIVSERISTGCQPYTNRALYRISILTYGNGVARIRLCNGTEPCSRRI